MGQTIAIMSVVFLAVLMVLLPDLQGRLEWWSCALRHLIVSVPMLLALPS